MKLNKIKLLGFEAKHKNLKTPSLTINGEVINVVMLMYYIYGVTTKNTMWQLCKSKLAQKVTKNSILAV